MTLHLFDSATRAVRELVPLRAGQVGLYVCGATVQGAPHIGHMRMAVAFDVLVRWLQRSGYAVTLVRNVTDIDDKILTRSAEAGVPWWAWAMRFEREFTAAYDALGVLPPTYEPRATGHITEMVELMQRLVETGHAYVTGDGDVWFDVRSFPEYGALTNQRPEDLPTEDQPAQDRPGGDLPAQDGAAPTGEAQAGEAAADGERGKRDPHDFALWKATRPTDPATASWPTPYGRGRPGWHLECSAMAHRYLGDTFDIHGGGLDLRFPHHENEQAQSRAAGHGFAQLWMHSAWVTQGGAKMSKSLGNSLLVSNVLEHTAPAVLRLALAGVQYRSMLEYTAETLADAEATWRRIAGFVQRAGEAVGQPTSDEVATAALPADFVAAMDDDLNVPAALAVVHEHVRHGNTMLAEAVGGSPAASPDHAAASPAGAVVAALLAVRSMLDVLGLDPVRWGGTQGDSRTQAALEALVRAELDARARARVEKDWATADAVRDRLVAAGVVVEDSPTGARWALAQDVEV